MCCVMEESGSGRGTFTTDGRREDRENTPAGLDKEICAPDCTFINAAAPLNCLGGSLMVNY